MPKSCLVFLVFILPLYILSCITHDNCAQFCANLSPHTSRATHDYFCTLPGLTCFTHYMCTLLYENLRLKNCTEKIMVDFSDLRKQQSYLSMTKINIIPVQYYMQYSCMWLSLVVPYNQTQYKLQRWCSTEWRDILQEEEECDYMQYI